MSSLYAEVPTIFPIRVRNGDSHFTGIRLKFVTSNLLIYSLPSNRVISSLAANFGIVSEIFLPLPDRLLLKISNLCKNHFRRK